MTTETEIVAAAAKTVEILEDKRRALIQKATELAEERQRVSFAAHTGDQKARQRLNVINTETGTHASEMASIEAAIIEANARLNVARTGAALAVDRAAAVKLRHELARFVELGELIDDALADVVMCSAELDAVLSNIHALGCPAPAASIVRVNAALAIKTAVMNIGWTAREWEFLAPNQRKSFKAIVSGWAGQVENNIAARLGEKKAA
jgi:hypothetical protein